MPPGSRATLYDSLRTSYQSLASSTSNCNPMSTALTPMTLSEGKPEDSGRSHADTDCGRSPFDFFSSFFSRSEISTA